MNRKISLSMAMTILLVAVTVTFSITMVIAMQMFDNTITSVTEKEAMFSNLSEIDTYVAATEYYDYTMDSVEDQLGVGYLRGVSDRYATFYTARSYTEYQNIQSGRLMGIGTEIVKDSATGYARVLRVQKESPADEVGITRDCYITAITVDETRYDVKALSDVNSINSRLRGEDGTTVTLDYIRADGIPMENVILTHHSYGTATVESTVVGGVCGYLRIYTFADSTAGELDTALTALQNSGAKAIVFDLRDNDGGSLNSALLAIDRVVGSGAMAARQSKNGEQSLLRVSDDTRCELPMVCLVNGSTACGAELFASCVRQMEGGSIVGVRTVGKGTIQSTPQRMSNGSAVSVTEALLLSVQADGSFATFDGEGLQPDIAAVLSATEEQSYYDLTIESDSQIQMAISRACTMAGVTVSHEETEESWEDDTVGEGFNNSQETAGENN